VLYRNRDFMCVRVQQGLSACFAPACLNFVSVCTYLWHAESALPMCRSYCRQNDHVQYSLPALHKSKWRATRE